MIPIVILNSNQILPARGWIMRAGTVHVRVLDPLDTRAWTAESLDSHVDRIEDLYRAQFAVDDRDA